MLNSTLNMRGSYSIVIAMILAKHPQVVDIVTNKKCIQCLTI